MQELIKGICIGLLGALSSPVAAQVNEVSSEEEVLEYPEPPALVAERIVNGRFEPGNFEYLRGYFPEASEVEKVDYERIIAWLETCSADGRARLDAELDALGVSYDGGSLIGAANVCQQLVTGEHFDGFASFEEVTAATRGARLVFDTLVQSIRRAEERAVLFTKDDLGNELHHRTIGEQMLRLAFHWGWSEIEDSRVPKMNSQERAAFLALLNSEVLYVDHQNTRWLKQLIDEQGWPTISKVGQRGSGAAWLLTQHADLDPAFQWRALRLMEPLVAEGEVSKRNYAYLYDRIMLKLTGKQRYGTQVTCKDGKRAPLPLEEADRLDQLRAEMGIEPIETYLSRFAAPCPN